MPNKILVVDDDKDFVQLLEFDLTKRGYKVSTAFNGEDGLEQVKVVQPDLIILDIKMPKVDGYTFVRKLKREEDTKQIPVIMLTSYEPMKDMFQLEGVKDYFVKSANMEGLLDAIKRHLQAGS